MPAFSLQVRAAAIIQSGQVKVLDFVNVPECFYIKAYARVPTRYTVERKRDCHLLSEDSKCLNSAGLQGSEWRTRV